MRKNKKPNIWDLVARIILRSRALILSCILLLTIFWSTQWKYMQFTYTEANLLPDNHPENILYQSFTKTFGEEGNIIVIALQDSTFFKKDKREVWKNRSKPREQENVRQTNYQQLEKVLGEKMQLAYWQQVGMEHQHN